MAGSPELIVQIPRGGALAASLAAAPPDAVADHRVVVELGVTDAEGNLEPPAAGEVVLSVLSPEALSRESDEVHRVIAHAGTGTEPLVIDVEAAEELRDSELAAVLAAAAHTDRPVILRVIRNA